MRISFEARPFDDLSVRELYALLQLRDEVFVVGQRITAEPEVDGLDPQCWHVIGRDAAGQVVATARLFLDVDPVKVGRIAVHPSLQRQGVGGQLMAFLHARIGPRSAAMSAQAHLESWYAGHGWRRVGDGYFEANIPHVRMVRP